MTYWPSLYGYVRTRKETEDLVISDMIYLVEQDVFYVDIEDDQLKLIRKSSETLGHPVFDNIGSSVSASELADYFFSLREKFFLWVIKSSEPYIRWDIESQLSKWSLILWIVSVIGWIPFYFLRARMLLMFWFALPCIAVILSVIKAPLTSKGRELVSFYKGKDDISSVAAIRGIISVKDKNLNLFHFSRLFKGFYRGRTQKNSADRKDSFNR